MAQRVGPGSPGFNDKANQIINNGTAKWQQRVGAGNTGMRINIGFGQRPVSGNPTERYNAYYQQCIASGQQPLSMMQYMQALQTGVDPINYINSQSAAQQMTPQETVDGILGLAKSIKNLFSKPESAEQKEAKVQEHNATVNELKTKGSVDLPDVDKFVDGQIAKLNPSGDGTSVSKESLVSEFKELGMPEDVLNHLIKNEHLSKEELTKVYNKAKEIGDGKIGAQEILCALTNMSVDEAKKMIKGET